MFRLRQAQVLLLVDIVIVGGRRCVLLVRVQCLGIERKGEGDFEVGEEHPYLLEVLDLPLTLRVVGGGIGLNLAEPLRGDDQLLILVAVVVVARLTRLLHHEGVIEDVELEN